MHSLPAITEQNEAAARKAWEKWLAKKNRTTLYALLNRCYDAIATGHYTLKEAREVQLNPGWHHRPTDSLARRMEGRSQMTREAAEAYVAEQNAKLEEENKRMQIPSVWFVVESTYVEGGCYCAVKPGQARKEQESLAI